MKFHLKLHVGPTEDKVYSLRFTDLTDITNLPCRPIAESGFLRVLSGVFASGETGSMDAVLKMEPK